MAILIVDDETSTREVLRSLLEGTGHKQILEARHGREALRILDAERSRVRFIIADWEMPYLDGLSLLAEVAKRKDLALSVFVLISSDLPKATVQRIQNENPRLDAYLVKPFRAASFQKTLREAYVHWVSRREKILVYSDRPDAYANIVPALVREKKRSGLWRGVLFARTPAEAEQAVADPNSELGALLLDAETCARTDTGWLVTFRKSPAGASTIIAGLGREPATIVPLRGYCQFFNETPDTDSRWDELLDQMHVRAVSSWEVEMNAARAKAAIQVKDFATARRIAATSLDLDPRNPQIHVLVAEVCELLGQTDKAISHYETALGFHPCLPKPYLRILELLRKNHTERIPDIAAAAIRFCPDNPNVLAASEKAKT